MNAPDRLLSRMEARHFSLCSEDALRREIARLVDDPWVRSLRRGDLRFGWAAFSRAPSATAVLRAFGRVRPEVSLDGEKEGAWLRRLLHAKARRWPAEVEDIGAAFATRAYTDPEAAARAVEAFVLCFGERAMSSQQAGKVLGVSGQRVRQRLQRLREVAMTRPVSSATAFQVAAYAAAHPHLADEELTRALAAMLGTVPAARVRSFCQDWLALSGVWDAGRGGAMAGLASVAAVRSDRFRRLAIQMVQRAGAVQIDRVVGALGLSDGATMTRAQVEQVAGLIGGWRWLGPSNQWFTIDGCKQEGVVPRIRKVLAVADHAVTLNELYEALLEDRRLFETCGEQITIPPPAILGELVSGFDWVERNPWGVRAGIRPNPVRLLSAQERFLWRVLRKRGNVAPVAQLVQAARAAGINDQSLKTILTVTPIAKRIGRGIYMLRGCRADREALRKALARRDGLLHGRRARRSSA